jgi:hypothetical protein
MDLTLFLDLMRAFQKGNRLELDAANNQLRIYEPDGGQWIFDLGYGPRQPSSYFQRTSDTGRREVKDHVRRYEALPIRDLSQLHFLAALAQLWAATQPWMAAPALEGEPWQRLLHACTQLQTLTRPPQKDEAC